MIEHILADETRYRLLQRLAEQPDLSQRALARELDISVGKVNYCLKALLAKGYIKIDNFRHSAHKQTYMYQLTPSGLAAKAHATIAFLQRKQAEYERLAAEIEDLREQLRAEDLKTAGSPSNQSGA